MIVTREEAITIIDNLHLIGCGRNQHEYDLKINVALDMAIEALKADRPQGEWIRTSNDWIDGTCGARYYPIHCSRCNYSTYDDNATNFCPNCGADMRR